MSKPMLDEGSGDLGSRPLAETSMAELEKLFIGSAKPDTQWYVGCEVELFTFHEDTKRPADHGTIRELLEGMGARLGLKPEHEVNGELIGLSGDGQNVSLEPGGQLELATRPHRSLSALRKEIVDWCRELSDEGKSRGLGFWALGEQPFVNRDTAPVMPKPRYAIMREHLTGSRGRDMMHLTGSVQVTVDFANEQNLVDKVRTAARVSPFFSALVAASPFKEGKLSGMKTDRYAIWLDTDAARCGIWPEMVDEEGLTAKRYIDRTLDTPAMFFRRGDGYRPADKETTLREYAQTGFEGTPVTVADYLDHLTTFFPEIRIKNYVEMRGADCLVPEEAVAVGGFWRGILDDEATRKAVDERLSSLGHAELVGMSPDIARYGLEADSPVGPVGDMVEWLVEAAYSRLKGSAPDCAECVLPLLERARRRRSPADDLIERAQTMSVADALDIVRI